MHLPYKFLKYYIEFPNYLDRKNEFSIQKRYIVEKKELISKVEWSSEQTKEYRAFWSENYGFIPAVEHCKYFESINGIYNYKYIPRALYASVIEPRMNPVKYAGFYAHKTLQNILFSGLDEIRIPRTFLSCMDGFYNVNDILVPLDAAVKQLSNIGEVIIKPTYWTSSGNNVRIMNVVNGVDINTNKSIKDIFKAYGKFFIVQELIKPCKTIQNLSLKSVNTFRVFTYLLDGVVHCGPVAFRIGVGNSITDNESTGGFATGVHDDGTLYKAAYSYEERGENTGSFNKFEVHPDTNVTLDGYYIGDLDKVKYAAMKAHSRVPNLGVLSWDFTLDENENVTFIEVNTMYCGTDLNEIGTGETLFGENTEKVLKSIYKAKKIGI